MRKIEIILSILLILCMAAIYNILSISSIGPRDACKDIGLEIYRNKNNMEYCEDELGNLHYVNLECDNFWKVLVRKPQICQVKLISVGNVRTIANT